MQLLLLILILILIKSKNCNLTLSLIVIKAILYLVLQLGCSALLLAAERCWESCINMLITVGANKNLVTQHGDSALAISTKANDRKSVNRLLNNNVRITTENKVCLCPGSKLPGVSRDAEYACQKVVVFF